VNDTHTPTAQPPNRLTVRPLVLIGASGFGREVLWVCRRAGLDVAGFCDDAADKRSGDYGGLPLLGVIEQAAGRFGAGMRFHCAVGNNRDRLKLAERAQAVGWVPATVIDPAAVISPDAHVGEGAFIGAMAFISCFAGVGRFALVNHHAGIGHDSTIGDYSQVCPGARVSGQCEVGEGAFLGSNAVLLPGRRMGSWSVLGAAALGLSDLAADATVARVR